MMMWYLKTIGLITIPMMAAQTSGSCPSNEYYDPHTESCHHCSDCIAPRTPNEFCLKDCKAVPTTTETKCKQGDYFDSHTENCHSCTDCKPPRTPNQFCEAQCTEDEKYGRKPSDALLSTTLGISPAPANSTDNIIIITLCVIMGIVILVLIVLGLLYWRKRLCKDLHPDRHLQHQRKPLFGNPGNGQVPTQIEMQSISSQNPQSFIQAVQHQPSGSSIQSTVSNRHSSGINMPRGMESIALTDDRDRTLNNSVYPSAHGISSGSTDSPHQSFHQDRSLQGNVVCQPESEGVDRCQLLPSFCQGTRPDTVHGVLAPSFTKASEEPHVSLDPNKGCDYEDQRDSRSLNSGVNMMSTADSSQLNRTNPKSSFSSF